MYPSWRPNGSFCNPLGKSRGREVSRWAEIDNTATQLYPSQVSATLRQFLLSVIHLNLYAIRTHTPVTTVCGEK